MIGGNVMQGNGERGTRVPEIRLGGFSEEWEEKELGTEIETIGTGKSSFVAREKSENTPYPILGSRSIIGYDSDYEYSGDFILTARVGENAGKLYKYSGKVKITDNTVYLVCENLQFTFYLLTNFDLRKLSFGTGQPLIKASELSKLKLHVSHDKNEQTKIGNFFQQIDRLISQHQQKHDKLLNIKKALLEKMFPQPGKTEPEIRFKGFSGEWEEKKLGDMCILITKGTTPIDKSGKGNINFIKVENINPLSGNINLTSKITRQEHENNLKRSQLMEGDILFSIAGTLGRITIITKNILPANTNQALAIVRLKQGQIGYITTCLKGRIVSEYIKKNPTVGAQPNLSLEQITNLELSLPNAQEQSKISNLFQQLDRLINQHQTQIQKLNHLKQAFLSKIFV